jgi:hypothetical protein
MQWTHSGKVMYVGMCKSVNVCYVHLLFHLVAD